MTPSLCQRESLTQRLMHSMFLVHPITYLSYLFTPIYLNRLLDLSHLIPIHSTMMQAHPCPTLTQTDWSLCREQMADLHTLPTRYALFPFPMAPCPGIYYSLLSVWSPIQPASCQ